MEELLKENKEFSELYNKECQRCYEKITQSLYSCSRMEVRNAFSYAQNIYRGLWSHMAYLKVFGLHKTDIHDFSENEMEELIRKIAKSNRIDVADCKFLYQCSVILKHNQDSLKKVADHYHIKKYEIDAYIKEGKELIENKTKHRKSKYRELVNQLEKINENEKIIKLLEENNINVGSFRADLCNVLILYYPERYEELNQDMLQKISVYNEYMKEKKKEDRIRKNLLKKEEEETKMFPFARDTVTKFINASSTIKMFCEKENIDVKEFNKYVDLIEKKDNDLYLEYKDKTAANHNKRYKIITNKINEVVDYIKNGIELENGEKRKFDIVDYYITQKYEHKEFKNIAQNVLNKKEYSILSEFFAIQKILEKSSPFNVKGVLSEVTEIDCKKDASGNLLIGTGRIITEEEKISVMEFLKENEVPLNNRTYSVAFKRYLKNQLFDSKENLKNSSKK